MYCTQLYCNTIIGGDFNTLTNGQIIKTEINKETQVLNDTLDEMDLIDILGHSIQMQKNTTSFQEHMEHAPG